jgi:hypothetical protein
VYPLKGFSVAQVFPRVYFTDRARLLTARGLGDIITEKRNRLGDSTANLLLLVKNWIGQPEVEDWVRGDDNEAEEAAWVDEGEWAAEDD